MIRRLLSLSRVGLTFTIALAASSARADKQLILIAIADQNGPARACADALMNARSVLDGAIDAEFRVISKDDRKQDDFKTVTHIDLQTGQDPTQLFGLPFVFRDAPHFQAYLQSDLFEAMQPRMPSGLLAVAYGGFFQMFSKAAAVTEPKHFYGRTIAGDARAQVTYHQFGAQATGSSMRAMMDNNYSPAEDFARMGRDDPQANIVEAVLGQAFENGADRNARYVNLVSSAVLPIEIEVTLSQGIWHDWSVQPDLEKRMAAWAQRAALQCSADNYEAELKVLQSLKAAGLAIVPFNRKALVGASWRFWLTQDHPFWTVDEFDRVEQLVSDADASQLPSAILAGLSAQEREAAKRFDADAQRVRKERAPSN